MSTISGNYSTVPLYSLYQAGQGGAAMGSTGDTGNSQDNSVKASNSEANQAAIQQSGSVENSQNALNGFQANQGSQAGSSSSAPQAPAPKTYSISNSGGSTSEDPSASFVNNQEANADYQSMVLNLGQGKIAAAAKDYAQLQADLKLHSVHSSGGSVAIDTNSADSSGGSVFSVTV